MEPAITWDVVRAASELRISVRLPLSTSDAPHTPASEHPDPGRSSPRRLGSFVVMSVLMGAGEAAFIGLPFAWAHLKLAGLALWPIGKAVVPVEMSFPSAR
jgi:hypothetical protein